MAQLSPEDLDVIAQHPLGNILKELPDDLQEALRGLASQNGDVVDIAGKPKVFNMAIRRLLMFLASSDVALLLQLHRELANLAFHLADKMKDIVRKVSSDDMDYECYRELSELVIKRAPDSEVWTAVVTLIRKASQTTPPPSRPHSSDDTPIKHSSASQQGSGQKAEIVEARVFEEIKDCTHTRVEGFYAKYFEGKSWDKRTKAICQILRNGHSDGQWLDFPEKPTEDGVCEWWFDFQKKFMPNARGVYYTTRKKGMHGQEKNSQVDLLVRLKCDGASENHPETHHWKDIRVIGELTVSKDTWKQKLLQISRYVREAFAHQPTRRFIHVFTLRHTKMETWVYDRSGPYSGADFDILKEPEKFIQVVCGYAMMSDEELGLDTFIEREGGKIYVTVPGDGCDKKFELLPDPIAHQRAIVCRGTSCYLARSIDEGNEYNYVVKFSWTSDLRPAEATLLEKAHDRKVRGVVKVVGHRQITSIKALREGLVFTKPHHFKMEPSSRGCSSRRATSDSQIQSTGQIPGQSSVSNPSRKRKSAGVESILPKRSRSNSQGTETGKQEDKVTYSVLEAQTPSLTQKSEAFFENRLLYILVISPAGRAISKFGSTRELLEGLRDAIKVHESLYKDGDILHRDISVNNIILTKAARADGFTGLLIDLDLAKQRNQSRSGARHRTGTMEFMAIEVLLNTSHTYRHDLESFFYVLLWLCAHEGWRLSGNRVGKPTNSKLSKWYSDTYEEIARIKRSDMSTTGLEYILKEFPPEFDRVKHLCRELREILFPGRGGDIFTGTPKDEEILYKPILKAFEDCIVEIKSGP